VNKQWLIQNAETPIRYILTRDSSLADTITENEEVKIWLSKLSDRALSGDLSNIHGSHDYRYENITGKCFILGLNAKIAPFGIAMRYFINFLDGHIGKFPGDTLTFGKMYHYRDGETVMACFMPFLGYTYEKSVRYVAEKRLNIVYNFAKQGRYNLYRADLNYPGAKSDWKPYILDPELYRDGNIALPSIHDLILFAGMYGSFSEAEKQKAETAVSWIFGKDYAKVHNRLYYYAPDDPSYKAKAFNSKVVLPDCNSAQPKDMPYLLFLCFILSHFETSRKSEWFAGAVHFLEQFRTQDGRYIFPKEIISEQKDRYVHDGGHMNVGESKKNKNYAEIISTYWMERIFENFKSEKAYVRQG
jgi:hypothetical protein